MRNRGTDDENVERDNYKVPALIEVISDSDWAADRGVKAERVVRCDNGQRQFGSFSE